MTEIRVKVKRTTAPVFTLFPQEWWMVSYGSAFTVPVAIVPNLPDAHYVARCAAANLNRIASDS